MASFDEQRFSDLLTTVKMGRKMVYTDVTGSTMDDARRLAHNVNEYPHGTIVMSEQQTKARGARRHKWNATNTGNIYASFILHMPSSFKTFEGIFDLEVASCLAVLETSRKFGVPHANPKWPNDVWVRGHKLAGFLAEDGRFDVTGSISSLIILGMGINVNADIRRCPELHSIATSLMCERGGVKVDREQFFADVCAALERTLSMKREEMLEIFQQENLFQRDCEISVTCPAAGKVFNGTFLEICNNWEVKFNDKRTGEILQGRSDHYTVRPKVLNKILVVFTGAEGKKSSNKLSQWLMSVVDTSKHIVCLVPETSITSTDAWMTNCSLLALPEHVCDPDYMSSKVKTFLKSNGHVMASGMGSLFVAKLLDIPLKEILLESSVVDTEAGIVHLRVESKFSTLFHGNGAVIEDICPSTSPSVAGSIDELPSTETLTFPSRPVCFQFFEDEKALLSEGGHLEERGNTKERQRRSTNENTDRETQSGVDCATSIKTKPRVRAFYLSPEDEKKSIAMFTSHLPRGGHIALWGFDIGVTYPGNPSGVASLELATVANEMGKVEADRFKRDLLLQQVLDFLLE